METKIRLIKKILKNETFCYSIEEQPFFYIKVDEIIPKWRGIQKSYIADHSISILVYQIIIDGKVVAEIPDGNDVFIFFE